MHRERAVSDAIVVGANTVRADNPSLTTRYWPGRSALRVVLDGRLSMPRESGVLTDGSATVVYNLVKSGKEGAVDYVQLPTCSPEEWLRDLYRRGVTSVMVEGGGKVLAQLIESDLWDEMRQEISPRVIQGGVAAPKLALQPQEIEKIGKNEVRIYRHDVKKV
ncbi:MAG: RibD family protein, partial [Muribaculaceae bacterium]|nr:RibD family protein [Muribaculaceae bacterium]